MLKRIISAAAAGALCLSGLAGCASKTEKSHSTAKSASLSGDYINVRGYSIRIGEFCDDLDEGIKASLTEAKDKSENNGYDFSLQYRIRFSGDDFTLSVPNGANYNYVFSGDYSVKNDRIYFDYSERSAVEADGTITRTVKLGDSDDRMAEAVSEMLEDLNKTGSYPAWFMPPPCASDKLNRYDLIPIIYERSTNFSPDSHAFQLIALDDVIAAETYGLSLDGSYKKGKDFTLSFDQLEVITEDPYSRYNLTSEEDQERVLELRKEMLSSGYSSDNTDTTIEFSDGRWEWLNHEGDLINNGEYQESSDYPGLIAMYTTENSLVNEMPCDMTLTMLYLSGGKVYFPCFVKA